MGELFSVDQSQELGDGVLSRKSIEVGDARRGLGVGTNDVAAGGVYRDGVAAHLIQGGLAGVKAAATDQAGVLPREHQTDLASSDHLVLQDLDITP